MDVILLERIEKLGQMGDIVRVKTGFARNYLLPQKKALRATKENLAYFETRRAQLETQNLEHRKEAEGVADKMAGTRVVMIRQAGEAGQLYGSVSARDVATGLTEAGFTVERRQVQIERPIKEIGITPVKVALHPEVVVEVEVNVARSANEAELQAARADRGEAPVMSAEEALEAAEEAFEGAGDEPDTEEEETAGTDARVE